MKLKTKKDPLVYVNGRAEKANVDVLRKHNINISALIRDAIEKAAKSLLK